MVSKISEGFQFFSWCDIDAPIFAAGLVDPSRSWMCRSGSQVRDTSLTLSQAMRTSSIWSDMKRGIGMTSWKVFTPQMVEIDTIEGAVGKQALMRDTMFPVHKRSDISEEEAKRINSQLPNW